jgi:hypothetical protein
MNTLRTFWQSFKAADTRGKLKLLWRELAVLLVVAGGLGFLWWSGRNEGRDVYRSQQRYAIQYYCQYSPVSAAQERGCERHVTWQYLEHEADNNSEAALCATGQLDNSECAPASGLVAPFTSEDDGSQ